jgi:hypothetical protein
MKRGRIGTELQAEIKEAAKNMTAEQLAQKFDRSLKAISKVLGMKVEKAPKAEKAPKPAKAPKAPKAPKSAGKLKRGRVGEDERAQILNDSEHNNMAFADICKKYNRSEDAIKSVLTIKVAVNDKGVTAPSEQAGPFKRGKVSLNEQRAMQEDAKTISAEEIATKYQRNPNTVKEILNSTLKPSKAEINAAKKAAKAAKKAEKKTAKAAKLAEKAAVTADIKAHDVAKKAAKAAKIEEKAKVKADKKAARVAKKAAKLAEKEAAKAAKVSAKEAKKQAKIDEKKAAHDKAQKEVIESAANLEAEKPADAGVLTQSRISNDEKEIIREEGKTLPIEEIAAKHKHTVSAVAAIINETPTAHKLAAKKPTPDSEKSLKKGMISEEEQAEIQEDYQNKIAVEDIAANRQRSLESILKVLHIKNYVPVVPPVQPTIGFDTKKDYIQFLEDAVQSLLLERGAGNDIPIPHYKEPSNSFTRLNILAQIDSEQQ